MKMIAIFNKLKECCWCFENAEGNPRPEPLSLISERTLREMKVFNINSTTMQERFGWGTRNITQLPQNGSVPSGNTESFASPEEEHRPIDEGGTDRDIDQSPCIDGNRKEPKTHP